MDGIKLYYKCRKCDTNTTVDNSSVKKREYKDRSGKSIWCMYFHCPQCGTKYVVQLDSIETNGMLIDITRLIARIARLRHQGKSVKKYQKRYDALAKELADARKKLADSYNGKTLMNAFGAEEKIEMCILNHEVENEKLSGMQ